MYDPWGKRVAWRHETDSSDTGLETKCELYIYGISGQRVASYGCGYQAQDGGGSVFQWTLKGYNVYFAGHMIQSNGVSVTTDRLGSVRKNGNSETFKYLPYGEELTSTADGREKFATYMRDSGVGTDYGLDYADQRYYDRGSGRFLTADPGGLNTPDATDPGTWNQYAYVQGDPINHADPSGMCTIAGVIYRDGYPPCPDHTPATVNGSFPQGSFGGGTGAPKTPLRLDPEPLTQSQMKAMISTLRRFVTTGVESDCDALADYVDGVAEGLQNSKTAAKDLKRAISLLTPNQFPVPLIPGVTGNPVYVALNPNGAASGFQGQYQDQIQNADQVHHFAAFFQLGFVYGGDVATSTASWWEKLEGTAGNAGDINLGAAAGLIGSYVASGVLPVADVGTTIRENICRH